MSDTLSLSFVLLYFVLAEGEREKNLITKSMHSHWKTAKKFKSYKKLIKTDHHLTSQYYHLIWQHYILHLINALIKSRFFSLNIFIIIGISLTCCHIITKSAFASRNCCLFYVIC